MQRSALVLVVCLAAVVFGSAPAAAQQKIDLRPKWETGVRHRFRMELDSVNAVNITGEKGGEEKHTLKQDIRFVLNVVDAPPESDATIELVYESFKVAMDSPLGKGKFDSTGSAAGRKTGAGGDDRGVLADVFGPLVGAKLTLIIDPAGNIKTVTGGDELTPAEMTAPLTQKGEMARLFGPIFSPKKGGGLVGVGEVWENVDAIDSGLIGTFRLTTKHTLKSAKDGVAVVAIDGKVETDTEGPQSTYTIRSGTYKGSYAWGLAEGMLRRMETSKSIKIEGGAGDPMAIGAEITMKMTREN